MNWRVRCRMNTCTNWHIFEQKIFVVLLQFQFPWSSWQWSHSVFFPFFSFAFLLSTAQSKLKVVRHVNISLLNSIGIHSQCTLINSKAAKSVSFWMHCAHEYKTSVQIGYFVCPSSLLSHCMQYCSLQFTFC